LVNSANGRAGIAAVFESEIRSICDVIKSFDLIHVLQTADLADYDTSRLLKQRMTTRSENYMEAFSRNVEKLANLPERAVIHTTAFYTYLKASRDATAVIRTWGETTALDVKKRDVEKILLQLQHCLIHAKEAVQCLSEKKRADTQSIDELLQQFSVCSG
jgi:hypothetical protein